MPGNNNSQNSSGDNVDAPGSTNGPASSSTTDPSSVQLPNNVDVRHNPEQSLNTVAPTNQQATITSTNPLPVKETVSTVRKPSTTPIEPTLADRMRSRFTSMTLPTSSVNEQPKQVASNPEIAVSKQTVDRVHASSLTPFVSLFSRQLPDEIRNIVAKNTKIVNKEVHPNPPPPITAPTQPMPMQPTVNPSPTPVPNRKRTRSLGTALKSRNQPTAQQTDLPLGQPQSQRWYRRNPRDPYFYNRMSTRSVSKALQNSESAANQEPQPDATNPESSIVSKRVRARSVAASAVTAQKNAVLTNAAAETAKPPAKKRDRPFKNKPPPPAVLANPAPETAPGPSLPTTEPSTVPKQPVRRVQPPPSTRMRTRSLSKAAWLSSQLAATGDAVPTELSEARQPVKTQDPEQKHTDAANDPSSSGTTRDVPASVDQQALPEKMPTLASVNPSPITEPVPAPPVNPPSPTPQQPVLTPSVAGPRLSSSSTELATSGNASELPQHQPKPLNAESLVEKRQRARSAVTGLKTLNLVQTPVTPNTPPPVQSLATRDSPRRSSQSTSTSAPSNVESVAPPALKRRVNRIPPSPPTRMRTRSFSKALHAAQSLAASKSAETVGKEVVQTGVTSSKEAIPPSVPVAPDSGQPTPKKRGRPFKNPQPANRIQLPPSTRMRLRSVSKALHLSQLAASKDAVPSGQQQRQPSPEKVAPMFKPTQTQSTAAAILPSEESQHVGKEANCVSSTSTTPQTTMTAQQRLLRPPRKMAPMSKPTRTQSATRIPSSEKSQIVGKEATCVSTTSTQTPQTTMTAQQRLLRPPRKMAPMSKPTRTQSATKIPSSEKSQNTEKEATCVPTTSTQTPQVTTTAPSSSLNSNAPPVPPRKVFVMSKPKQTPSAASGIPPSETGQKAIKVNLSLFLRKPLEYTEDGLLVLDKNGPKATKAARRCSHSDSDSDYAENPAVPYPLTPIPSPSPVPAFSNRKRTHSIAESHASSQSKRPNLATASPPLFNDNPTDDDFVFPNFTRVSSVNATVLSKAVEPAALSSLPTLTTLKQRESTQPAPTSPPTLTPLVNEVVPVAQPPIDKQSEPPALKRKRASPAAVSPTSPQPKPCSPTSSQPKPSKSTSVPSKPVMTIELLNVTPLDVASIYAQRPPATVENTKPSLNETATYADPPSPSHSIDEPSPPPVPAVPDQVHDSADESDAEPKHKRWKPLSTPIMATRLRVRNAHQKHSETPTPPKEPKAKQPRSKSAAVRKNPISGKPDSQPTSVSKAATPRIIQLPSSSQKQKVQDAKTTSAGSSKPAFEPAPRPPTPIEPELTAAYDVVAKLAPSVHPKSGYDPHIVGELAESCWNAVLEAVEKEELEGVPVKPNYPCVMPWQRDPADPTFGLTPENIAARNKMALPLPRQPGDTLPRSYLCPDGLRIITEKQYTQIVLAHNLAVDKGTTPQIRCASEPRQKIPAKKKPAPIGSKTPKKKPVPAAKTPSHQPDSSSSSMSRPTVMSTKSHSGASKASTNPAPGSKTPVRCHPVVITPVMRSQQSTPSKTRPPAALIRVPDRPAQGIVMVSDNNNDNQFRPPPAEILESRHVVVPQQNRQLTRPSNQQHSSRLARNPVQVGVPKLNQRDNSSSSDSLD